MPDKLARRFDLRRHVSQPELYRLMLEQGLVEALAVFRIRQRRIERIEEAIPIAKFLFKA